MVEVMLRIIMVRGQLGFMARLGFGSDKGQTGDRRPGAGQMSCIPSGVVERRAVGRALSQS